MRKEHDALGERFLPDDVYYGIQTSRAMENFNVSDNTFKNYPDLVRSLIEVKKACAITNHDIGGLSKKIADAIVQACDECLFMDTFEDQFPVNVSRGCGTSLNMNVNEVLANRANEIITGKKGFDQVHPNTHVNMCQSSNDVFPAASSITIYRRIEKLLAKIMLLEDALKKCEVENQDIVRLGRTCMQDAVPMTVGQGFSSYFELIQRNRQLIEKFWKNSNKIILGASAVGTSIGVFPHFIEKVYPNLSKIVGFKIEPANNFFDGMQNSDGLMILSSYLRNIACFCSKFANDIRLLASGPCFGINELVLDSQGDNSEGRSLYACKLISQLSSQIWTNEFGTCLSAHTGEPDIAPSGGIKVINTLDSLELLNDGISIFINEVLLPLRANPDICYRHAEESMSLATLVSTFMGYEIASKIVKVAHCQEISCKNASIQERIFSPEVAQDLFNVQTLTCADKMKELIEKYR